MLKESKKVKNSLNQQEMADMLKKDEILYNDKYVAYHLGTCTMTLYNKKMFGKGKIYPK